MTPTATPAAAPGERPVAAAEVAPGSVLEVASTLRAVAAVLMSVWVVAVIAALVGSIDEETLVMANDAVVVIEGSLRLK